MEGGGGGYEVTAGDKISWGLVPQLDRYIECGSVQEARGRGTGSHKLDHRQSIERGSVALPKGTGGTWPSCEELADVGGVGVGG